MLRVVLSTADDLTADEKVASSTEPLLTPPSAWDRSQQGAAIGDEAAIAECLSVLDARSLRELKTVSATWRARARVQLGDPQSGWRMSPQWSPGEWARGWFSERLSHPEDTMRKRGLLGMDALEVSAANPAQPPCWPRHARHLHPTVTQATVELPEFAADCVARLSDERSSNRALALRALCRIESLTLALHSAGIVAAIPMLEPHEHASDAAAIIRRKLGVSSALESGPAATPTSTHPEEIGEQDGGQGKPSGYENYHENRGLLGTADSAAAQMKRRLASHEMERSCDRVEQVKRRVSR